MELINKTIPLFLDSSGNVVKTVSEKVTDNISCSQISSFNTTMLIMIVVVLLIIFNKKIKSYIDNIKGNKGYIKIFMILNNRKLKEILVPLDEHKNFKFGGNFLNKKKQQLYNLDKMSDFIVGYDSNNIPIFMYQENFILPLKIDMKEITDDVKEQYKENGIELEQNEIEAIMLRIDSQTYTLAWSRKLIKDLYDISKEKKMDKMMFWIIIGIIAFIAWQTGVLPGIIDKLQNFNGG